MIRLVQQCDLNNDWLPLRADMRDLVRAWGFDTRQLGDGRWEFCR